MKWKFTQWWSTIPLILTNQSPLTEYKQDHDIWRRKSRSSRERQAYCGVKLVTGLQTLCICIVVIYIERQDIHWWVKIFFRTKIFPYIFHIKLWFLKTFCQVISYFIFMKFEAFIGEINIVCSYSWSGTSMNCWRGRVTRFYNCCNHIYLHSCVGVDKISNLLHLVKVGFHRVWQAFGWFYEKRHLCFVWCFWRSWRLISGNIEFLTNAMYRCIFLKRRREILRTTRGVFILI